MSDHTAPQFQFGIVGIAIDDATTRVIIEFGGIGAVRLDVSDARDVAAAILRACDEIAQRRKARAN